MNKFLLSMLMCPQSGGELHYDEKSNELICYKSKLAYPIENDIPIMLIDSARQLKDEELNEEDSNGKD
ncbi:MAG: hypothetical protein CMD88_05110 [Gammaproteobacteria bacterium]|nr:hypothetical protein [Gammaproteobacteria bacterium]|tara:strand:+ start:40355 stop:40558 length:204 start_codon:yes stop_codon:yes gene_type:complete